MSKSPEATTHPETASTYERCELHGAEYLDDEARGEQVEGVARLLALPGVGFETSLQDRFIIEVSGPLSSSNIDSLRGLAARSMMKLAVQRTGDDQYGASPA